MLVAKIKPLIDQAHELILEFPNIGFQKEVKAGLRKEEIAQKEKYLSELRSRIGELKSKLDNPI